MDRQIENKNKREEIQACYLLTKKGKLSATYLQPDQQIPWAKPRQETYLESPHLYTTETPGPQKKELYWIIGKHCPLSLKNKLLIYKAILKPAWTYALKLWGCASPSNIAKTQRYQSKMLRLITNAPWFVTLHQGLCIKKVRNMFH